MGEVFKRSPIADHFLFFAFAANFLSGAPLGCWGGRISLERFATAGGGTAVDADLTGQFGMQHQSNITYYDGKRLPFDDNRFDHVLFTEVLEHVDSRAFLSDLQRVLRVVGALILTVPCSARIHHLPQDYGQFTRFELAELLNVVGFTSVTIQEHGNDVAVIANKLVILLIRLLRSTYFPNCTWTWLLAVMLLPLTCVFLGIAHVALILHAGSRDDPLGYGVITLKTGN